MAKQWEPSEARTYDVEMIRDFFDHLLWEARISHFEATSGGRINPELVDQLQRYQKKRQTVGLLYGTTSGKDLNQEEARRIRETIVELREEQLRHLEALRPLIDEALKCAAHPTVAMYRKIDSADQLRPKVDSTA